jgi:signal transduction histidine kinase
LGELLGRFGERTGVAATLRADASAGEMADERAETVFRIVEEALRNVERHAQARSVRVDLESLPGSVGGGVDARMRVVVTDDGVGFDSAASYPGHYGLVGMREQAALVGATLQVKSAPGQGTSIGLEFAA